MLIKTATRIEIPGSASCNLQRIGGCIYATDLAGGGDVEDLLAVIKEVVLMSRTEPVIFTVDETDPIAPALGRLYERRLGAKKLMTFYQLDSREAR